MIELPLRTEFGYERKVCGCEKCRDWCKRMPGMLIPADLGRIKSELVRIFPLTRPSILLENFLLASPGAIVSIRGVITRIPTIVPARDTHQQCVFFSTEEKCLIHDVAPFGCAFFACDDDNESSKDRMTLALRAVAIDWSEKGPYSTLWQHLWDKGLRAIPPERCR